MERPATPQPIARRHLLQTLLVLPATLAISPSLFAATEEGKEAQPDLALAAATMGLISTSVGTVLPETTEGPYYLDPRLIRSDITEGLPGIPLRLQLQVVTADCRPVAGSRVDIWHCDARGNYSGYANQGSDAAVDTASKTFLRGTQTTDQNGVATFATIYPGWYRGRTTHIHYKVFLNEKTVLTSQIFFPDALSEYVYEKSTVYQRPDSRDTLNSIDGIAAQAGEGAYCSIREQKDRYIAALVIGIDPKANWSENPQGMPGGRPPGGPPKDGQPPTGGPRPGQGGPPPGAGRPPGGPPKARDTNTRIFPGT